VFITFLSDFGLKDDFVGTCHGVIKRIAPEAQIIDITHGIPATSILQGALVLANTIDFMPVGVHLAIVDPGVGGPRRPLALRDGEGRLYVGDAIEPLAPGSAFRLHAREVHIVENTHPTEELAVLGIFTPAGSPSAAYLMADVFAGYMSAI